MRIVYITAGAAGMYCGSCMRDNTLTAALAKLGHEALLVPTYTPIRTDEEDVSQKDVFFGGVNVYLQQKFWLFRHTPWFLDRLLNFRGLLNWVSRFAAKTQANELGELTVSMLQGEHGHQKKEVEKLVRWLASDAKPEVVNLTNALLSGMVHEFRRQMPGVPVICSLQGDDIFTESLPEKHRATTLQLIRDHCKEIDAFIATSTSYADFMADYFSIDRQKIHVVYPGLNLTGHGQPRPPRQEQPFTIGYFARICAEKGLHNLVDAFVQLKKRAGCERVRLHVSGWLGEHNRPFFSEQIAKITKAGLLADFAHIESPSHADKVKFLHEIDLLSVPTDYREPKGLYVLEALANGVPVVQPGHGSFPELITMTQGGLVYPAGDAGKLVQALAELSCDRPRAEKLGQQGQSVVRERFTATRMAEETVAVYRGYAT
jgi:glycosyltransferase involved in cell wall biosynthesis